MGPVDPARFPLDVERYRSTDRSWLDDLPRQAVRTGPPHHRMGTRAIGRAAWLVADGNHQSELALRARLVDEVRPEVFAAIDGSGPAMAEAAHTVGRWLDRHPSPGGGPWPGRPGLAAAPDDLVAAGLAVQEDLCLMERRSGAWVLTAGLVCFPTYWCLADKIGRPQAAVHGPVPHFAEELSDRVDHFFDRLPPDRIVARHNWGLSPHCLLFLPRPPEYPGPPRLPIDDVWLRSERQTLRKLPETGAVLFTIRVRMAPLTALVGRPGLAAGLLAAIDSWSPELADSRSGSAAWMPGIRRWLGSIADEPATTTG